MTVTLSVYHRLCQGCWNTEQPSLMLAVTPLLTNQNYCYKKQKILITTYIFIQCQSVSTKEK